MKVRREEHGISCAFKEQTQREHVRGWPYTADTETCFHRGRIVARGALCTAGPPETNLNKREALIKGNQVSRILYES